MKDLLQDMKLITFFHIVIFSIAEFMCTGVYITIKFWNNLFGG